MLLLVIKQHKHSIIGDDLMKKNDNVFLSGLATAGARFKMSYETHHISHHIYITNSEMQNIFEVHPSNDSQNNEDSYSTDEDLLLSIA